MSGRLSAGVMQPPVRWAMIYGWWTVFLCALVGAFVSTTVLYRLTENGHLQAWVLIASLALAIVVAVSLFTVTDWLEERASPQLVVIEEMPA